MFDSVRTRLTVAIALLTALSLAAAVFFGTQVIEADLVDSALNESVEQYLDEDGIFVPFGFDSADAAMSEAIIDDAFPSGSFVEQGAIEAEFSAQLEQALELGIISPELFFILSTDPVVFGAEGFDSPALDGIEFPLDPIDVMESFADPDVIELEMFQLQASFDRIDRLGYLQELLATMGRSAEDPVDIALLGLPMFVVEGGAGSVLDVARFDPSTGHVERLATPVESGLLIPSQEIFAIDDVLSDGRGLGASADEIDLRFLDVVTAGGWNIGVFSDVAERVSSLEQIRDSLWFAAAVLTALAALATWLLTGRALRPVAAITQRVGAISAGNLDERVPVPETRDEVNELATTMNGMLDRLEEGDRKRRQFVSDASHELRTPVAVLKSEAEVALRTPETTEVADLASAVLSESDRLGAMVEDLLTLARSDETRPSVGEPEGGGVASVVDLDELVLADAQRQRRLPIELNEVSAGRVRGSRDELSRVIAHLLDNAVRHGQSRVAVGLRQSLDNETVELWVDDDGDGVKASESERIFERFVRLDEARHRDGGGAGLGLAVVRSTVVKLGGTVSVLDSPFGGARFLVRLPLA